MEFGWNIVKNNKDGYPPLDTEILVYTNKNTFRVDYLKYSDVQGRTYWKETQALTYGAKDDVIAWRFLPEKPEMDNDC